MADAIDEAARMARKSEMLHRHGAVIVRQGEIVAKGYNKRTNVFHHSYSFHAEVSCLIDLKRRFPNESKCRRWLKDTKMFLVRVGPDAQGNPLKNSLPCKNCSCAIREAGIPIVFYSSEP